MEVDIIESLLTKKLNSDTQLRHSTSKMAYSPDKLIKNINS